MFTDRRDAGRRLGARLEGLAAQAPVVIGLPRGGVPVAAEVATALHAPLDVIVVRKIGVPGHEELGMGAAAEDGVTVFNDDILHALALAPDAVQQRVSAALDQVRQRVTAIRAMRPALDLRGRTVVIVDDGVATGIDARAACRCARGRGAAHVVLATPIAPAHWERRLAGEADEYVAVETDADFAAVGQYYEDFGQTTDEEVLECLKTTA